MSSEIQSVLFDKSKFTKKKAREWLKEHDMKSPKVDETDRYYRYRQQPPSKYSKFRTKELAPGVKAIIGIE